MGGQLGTAGVVLNGVPFYDYVSLWDNAATLMGDQRYEKLLGGYDLDLRNEMISFRSSIRISLMSVLASTNERLVLTVFRVDKFVVHAATQGKILQSTPYRFLLCNYR